MSKRRRRPVPILPGPGAPILSTETRTMSLRFGFRQRSIFYPRSFTMFPIPTTFGFLLLLWFATTRRESPQTT